MTAEFSAIVVEDNPVIARQLANCVKGNRWLTLAGVAGTEQDAIDLARRVLPDLVLLDFTLPDSGVLTPMAGFHVWHALHELAKAPTVIAVTASKETDTVLRARNHGAFDYVIKPITSADIATRLDDFTTYRRWLRAIGPSVNQGTIERIWKWRRRSSPLPDGIFRETLDTVIAVLLAAERPLRAHEIADRVGMRRESANRYLVYLCDSCIAERTPAYGRGHPAYLYTLAPVWNSAQADPDDAAGDDVSSG